jgi:hypothetical protein
MRFFKAAALCLPLLAAAGQVSAQDFNATPTADAAGRTTFYIGGGKSRDEGEFESDKTPFSIGIMHQVAGRKLILGGDIGREGTMLDSTWGQYEAVEQATSYNFLIGANIVDTGRFKTNAALLVGMREETSECSSSYLGYQCYADTAPENEYTANIGAVVSFSFDRVSLGVRATSESTQLLAGFRF